MRNSVEDHEHILCHVPETQYFGNDLYAVSPV